MNQQTIKQIRSHFGSSGSSPLVVALLNDYGARCGGEIFIFDLFVTHCVCILSYLVYERTSNTLAVYSYYAYELDRVHA